jgi:probable addiction module antidote protein
MPAFFIGENMSERSLKLPSRPLSRRDAADAINRAFESSDITEVCQAIGAAIRDYNVSDIANECGIARQTLYRAFAGGRPKHPNFTTILTVLDALGFQLHVTVRRKARARWALPKAVPPPES